MSKLDAMPIETIGKYFELVKFEHTAFALPFAYLGMMLAPAPPDFFIFFWVTFAMIGARTCGMTLNRLIDAAIDAKNPRTKNRSLVTGEIRVGKAWFLVAASLVVFLFSAWKLNPLCLKLSPAALLLLSGYHFVKRFSFLCHWALGMVLAIAPLGGWVAASGSFSLEPIFLSVAVLFWVAGFDILYSLQDMEFDRRHKLYSVPACYGVERSILISRICHMATVFFLLVFGWVMGLGVLYWTGVVVTAGLLFFEQRLVSARDLSKINTAFFSVNGWIGVLLLVFTFLDIFRG